MDDWSYGPAPDLSLEDLSEEENARLWAEEAARRDAEWDRVAEPARSAEDVFRETKARLK